MRNIRIADPRDRAPQRVDAPSAPRDRRREIIATLPMLLLIPALVFAFNPAAASTKTAPDSTATAEATDGAANVVTAAADSTATTPVSTTPTSTPKATTPKAVVKAATATPKPTTVTRTTAASTDSTPSPSVGGGYILIARSALMARPTSGASWATLKSWADKGAGTPSLSDQNNQNDIVALAKSMVYARTGIAHYRTEAIAMLKAAKGTEARGTLAEARNTAPLALAADFLSWHDAAWQAWLASLRPDLIAIHTKRPNNWGTHAGASRLAVDLFLRDGTDLARAAAVFHGWTGDRAAYAGFKYGEMSWQANPAAPVGIDPVGAKVGGMNVDGILPDDMRRGGAATSVGADGVSYTWEALQGALLQAELLHRAGYASYSWGDQALRRAVVRMYALGHPASGDDDWQPSLVNARYGTSFAEKASTHPGKAFGFADWLWG